MTANSVSATGQEASAALAEAVVEVARRAIDPTLEPFQTTMAAATAAVTQQAQRIGSTAKELDEALEDLERHFTVAATTASRQDAALTDAVAAMRAAESVVRDSAAQMTVLTRSLATGQETHQTQARILRRWVLAAVMFSALAFLISAAGLAMAWVNW